MNEKKERRDNMIAVYTRAMSDFVFFIGHNIKSSSKDKYRPIWSKLDVTVLKTEANECSQAKDRK